MKNVYAIFFSVLIVIVVVCFSFCYYFFFPAFKLKEDDKKESVGVSSTIKIFLTTIANKKVQKTKSKLHTSDSYSTLLSRHPENRATEDLHYDGSRFRCTSRSLKKPQSFNSMLTTNAAYTSTSKSNPSSTVVYVSTRSICSVKDKKFSPSMSRKASLLKFASRSFRSALTLVTSSISPKKIVSSPASILNSSSLTKIKTIRESLSPCNTSIFCSNKLYPSSITPSTLSNKLKDTKSILISPDSLFDQSNATSEISSSVEISEDTTNDVPKQSSSQNEVSDSQPKVLHEDVKKKCEIMPLSSTTTNKNSFKSILATTLNLKSNHHSIPLKCSTVKMFPLNKDDLDESNASDCRYKESQKKNLS